MKHSTIYIGENTHDVEIAELKDRDGNVQTDAAAQLTAIKDSVGTDVAGVPGLPLTLAHVSNGLYRGTLVNGGSFVAGQTYKATIKATGSQGYKAEWIETLIAAARAA